MTFEEKLEQYAELAVKVGVNIQKGQYLLINTTTDTLDFTKIVVKKRTKREQEEYMSICLTKKLPVLFMNMERKMNLASFQNGLLHSGMNVLNGKGLFFGLTQKILIC